MSNEISISSLTMEDAKTFRNIAILEIIAWNRTPCADEIEARILRLKQELEKSGSERKSIFVAKRSGEIVGIGRVEKTSDDAKSWMLFGIAVHPEHRRQGVGEMLAQASIAFAKSNGGKIMLSEAHADNVTSIAFHRSIGFVQDCRFTAADGDGKIAFSMSIS